MKVRLLTGTIIVFLILLSIKSFSQGDLDNPLLPVEKAKPIYVGPVVGYNKTIHNVDLLTFDDPTKLCQPFEKGGSNGFYAGISFEYLLGDVKASQSSIIGRVLFNSMPAFMERGQDDYYTLVQNPQDPTKWDPMKTSTKHEGEVSYNLLTAEICYKLNPIPKVPLGFTVGPTFDFVITKKMYQTYKLIGDPLNAKFIGPITQAERDLWNLKGWKIIDDGRTILIKDGPIDKANPFRLGLKVGVQYEIITGTQMYIVPAIYYNYGITKVTSKDNWRVSAIQIGVDVRWAL
ncbi:MAG: hypothetical protein EPN82_04290 [Bacteroidetes bacterium]|nr:MAG: hypothetical protein EPN82_04290 [Bacteroidota bacterium]